MTENDVSTIGHCAASDIVANGHSTLEELVMDLLFSSLNSFGLGPIKDGFFCVTTLMYRIILLGQEICTYMHGLSYHIPCPLPVQMSNRKLLRIS